MRQGGSVLTEARRHFLPYGADSHVCATGCGGVLAAPRNRALASLFSWQLNTNNSTDDVPGIPRPPPRGGVQDVTGVMNDRAWRRGRDKGTAAQSACAPSSRHHYV